MQAPLGNSKSKQEIFEPSSASRSGMEYVKADSLKSKIVLVPGKIIHLYALTAV